MTTTTCLMMSLGELPGATKSPLAVVAVAVIDRQQLRQTAGTSSHPQLGGFGVVRQIVHRHESNYHGHHDDPYHLASSSVLVALVLAVVLRIKRDSIGCTNQTLKP